MACSLFGGPLDRMRYGLYREVCSSLAAERKSLAFHVSDARLRTLICVQSQKKMVTMVMMVMMVMMTIVMVTQMNIIIVTTMSMAMPTMIRMVIAPVVMR